MRASRFRLTTDLVFAFILVMALVLGVLGALMGLTYWTKMDLGIDLFTRHLFDNPRR